MTEGEAKQKRCGGPDGTGTTINPSSGQNMKGVIVEGCMPRWCIASDCMMWQWNIGINRELAATGDINRDDYEGYCGLINKP